MSTFRGLGEVIAENGLFCSLYADRASHYWHTPEAGGGVDKDNPTQVGRALAQLGIELIAAYSPQARGRSERMFGTLQKRLPQELRLAGIATMAEANRFLEELFWPAHNARFARPAADTGSAFVAFAGTLEDILCAQRTASSRATTPCATRTARCRSRPIATATTTSRRRSGCTNIPTATWPSSTDPGVWRATAPTAKPSTTTGSRPRDPLRRDRARACGEVDSSAKQPT